MIFNSQNIDTNNNIKKDDDNYNYDSFIWDDA